jgi:hypothetical protein
MVKIGPPVAGRCFTMIGPVMLLVLNSGLNPF